MKYLSLALAFVIGTTTTLWAKIDPDVLFDISDVSMLMPLPDLKAPTKVDLPFSASGNLGVLFSKANFKKLPLIKNVVKDLDAAYANSYITGIRLDPCAPAVADDADPKKCGISLMRLVGQILEEGATHTEALDFGIHLIYAVKVDATMVEALQKLKIDAKALGMDTQGEGLGVHKVLRGAYRKNAKAVEWGIQLKDFVLKYAGEKAQIASSIMVTNETADKVAWEWAKVPFDPTTKTVFQPGDKEYEAIKASLKINNVAGTHFSHSFTSDLGERAGVISAKSDRVPELEGLLEEKIPAPKDAQNAYDAAYKIENPRLLAIPQADCVSCHVATPYRLAAEKEWSKAASSFEFPAVAGITGKMQKKIEDFMSTKQYVVLNFAYLADSPSISQRTVNESVEVARFLNANFISK